MYHSDAPQGTPAPADTVEEPELTEEEATAELDRLEAAERAKRAADRAHLRAFSRDMATHMVEELAALDPATRQAVRTYLTGLHMVCLWIDDAEAGEALEARDAAEATALQAGRGGA